MIHHLYTHVLMCKLKGGAPCWVSPDKLPICSLKIVLSNEEITLRYRDLSLIFSR